MEEGTNRSSDYQTLTLVELCDTDFEKGIEPSIFLPSEISTKISESEHHHNGNLSQGIMWQPLHSRRKKHQQTQIMLLSTSFKRSGIPKAHLADASTQTCHFENTATATITTKISDKADAWNECKEECIISGCNIKRDTDDSSIKLYQIKCQESQILLISEALEFKMPEKLIKSQQLLLCSKHFVTSPENVGRKSKVSKTSTIDLVPTLSNRPRRKPKPNRAYDWAEVELPKIHAESSEEQKNYETDEEPVYYKSTKSRGRKRKHYSSRQKILFNKASRGESIFNKQDNQGYHSEVHHSNVYSLKVLGMGSDKEHMVCDTSVQCSVGGYGESNLSFNSDGSHNIDWQRFIESLSIILEELGSEVACHPRVSACINSYVKGFDDNVNWHHTINPAITILRGLAYGYINSTEKSDHIFLVSEQTDEEELEIRIQDASQTMGGPISSVTGHSSQYQYQKQPEMFYQEGHNIHHSINHIEQNTYLKETEDPTEEVYHSYETETANNQMLTTYIDDEPNRKKRLRMSLSQKKDLCLLKEEYPTITNENIGKVFHDQWGFTVSKSTVRDILKEKDRWLAVTDKDIEADIKIPKHKTITPWIRQKLCQYKNENPHITIGQLVLWARDNLNMILDESIAQEILRFDEMWKNLISHTSDSKNDILNQERLNDFEGDDSNKGKLLKVSIKQKQDLCLLKEEYPNIPFEKLGKIFHEEWGFIISKTAAREIYRDRDKWLSTNPESTCRTRSKPPSTISGEQKMALCQLQEEFPFITREEIAKIFFLEWGIDMSLSTISGILKDRTKWLQFDDD